MVECYYTTQAEKSLAEVKSENERILIATFNGSPNTTIIATYAPTEGSEDSEAHYDKLSEVTNSIPKHNFLIETETSMHIWVRRMSLTHTTS